nr:unnamed protein product [Digitaria exilis]
MAGDSACGVAQLGKRSSEWTATRRQPARALQLQQCSQLKPRRRRKRPRPRPRPMKSRTRARIPRRTARSRRRWRRAP